VFAAFVVAVVYLALSIINIFLAVSALRKKPPEGLFSMCKLTSPQTTFLGQQSITFIRDYVTQLGMLCQNNWYYAVGYSVYLFLTYLWFGSLTTSDLGAWKTLGLDSLRCVVLCSMATVMALFVLPFHPVKDAAPLQTKREPASASSCLEPKP
jgi:hypothetical protein